MRPSGLNLDAGERIWVQRFLFHCVEAASASVCGVSRGREQRGEGERQQGLDSSKGGCIDRIHGFRVQTHVQKVKIY